MLVIFVFLADMRAAVVVSVSIPLAFLASLVVLWFSPYTMNMVTLSGLIISVGMVVDASIVVLENIYRHYRAMEHPDAALAAREGTSEVALAVTAGMLTTVIVLIPVMFTGGYSQQTMRPLNMMISATLVASLLIALTVVPLMASRLLARPHEHRNFLERLFARTDKGVGLLSRFYLGILRRALRWRVVTLVLAAAFFLVTMRVVKPLIGGELMPPMDTGIVNLEFDTPTRRLSGRGREDARTRSRPWSTGSRAWKRSPRWSARSPGEVSFGGGGATAQSGKLTIQPGGPQAPAGDDLADPGQVAAAAAADRPACAASGSPSTAPRPCPPRARRWTSSSAGRIRRSSAGWRTESLQALKGLPGLVDVRRSWYYDKTEYHVDVDPALARLYGTTPADVAAELKGAVKGVTAIGHAAQGLPGHPHHRPVCRPRTSASRRSLPMPTSPPSSARCRCGRWPRWTPSRNQPFITRERLRNTIDITGVNRVYTIGQVAMMAQMRLAHIQAPAGYSIEVAGTAADMKTGSAEMGRALMIGFVLLYILLVAMFKSFVAPGDDHGRHPAGRRRGLLGPAALRQAHVQAGHDGHDPAGRHHRQQQHPAAGLHPQGPQGGHGQGRGDPPVGPPADSADPDDDRLHRSSA